MKVTENNKLLTDLQLSITNTAMHNPVVSAVLRAAAQESGKSSLEVFVGTQPSNTPTPTTHLAESGPGTAGYCDEASKVRDAEKRLDALYGSAEYIKNGQEQKAIDAMLDAWPELCKWDNALSAGSIDQGELDWLLEFNDRHTPSAFNAATELVYAQPELLKRLMAMNPVDKLTTAKLLGVRSSLRAEQSKMKSDAAAGKSPQTTATTSSTTTSSTGGTTTTASGGTASSGGTTSTDSSKTPGETSSTTAPQSDMVKLLNSPMSSAGNGQTVSERLGNAQDAITGRMEEISKKLADPNLSTADREAANRTMQQLSQAMTSIANMLQLYMTMQQNLAKMYNDIARAALNNIR